MSYRCSKRVLETFLICAVAACKAGGSGDEVTPPSAYALTVSVTGSGTVSSSPAGISCPGDCSEEFAAGTVVTLVPTPGAADARFEGWGGACTGAGACTVTLSAARSVTATFGTTPTRVLTVGVSGPGTLSSSPAGISCPGDCTEDYLDGTAVTLAPLPEGASARFDGWSGDCTGTGGCTVTMSAARSVTASFGTVAAGTRALNVVRVGSGSGTVSSDPAGIACGATCSATFTQDSIVTLAAAAAGGSVFTGWSGGGGSGTAATCPVTLAVATTVTARFDVAVGLTARPSNPTCLSFEPTGGGPSTATLTLERAFPGLSFEEPVALVQAPGDASRWFVVERAGVVRVFAATPGVTTSSVFLDLTSRIRTGGELEAGLLGLAFDPDFGVGAGKNQRLYVFYSGAPNSGFRLRSTLSRFTANAAATGVDLATEVELIGLDKLESNHNGGNVAFGPDGYLYAGYGDGGGDPNPQARQDGYLFGKIIRIDPDGTTGAVPYAIPADNPNAGNVPCHATGRGEADCPEVWARGLRNPWRWSFDRQTGQLWVGDVGWGSYEEVDLVTRDGDYGWPTTEGPACVTAGCDRTGITDPVYSVPRGDGQAITGGYVYRGPQTTDLAGQYLFGDFASRLFGAVVGISGPTPTFRQLIAPFSASSISVSAFGEANDGELYALDFGGGGIHRLVFSTGSGGGGGGVTAPTLLSQTGCVIPADPTLPAAGLVGYEINAPFWSDGASKERLFALPDGTSFTAGPDGEWSAPPRTVTVKNFRLGGQLIETRLLMRQANGDWAGYSYEWNAAQSDATLVGAAGKDVQVGGQTWTYPGRTQCLQCHTQAAGFLLGLETQQLNRSATYRQTGTTAHQLTTLSAAAVGLLTPAIADPNARARLPDPFGNEPLGARARAYLHTNCAMCHRPGGPTPVPLDFRASTSLAGTNACDQDATTGTFGVPGGKIIAPGLPASSVLLARVGSRELNQQMPPLASHVVDAEGLALLNAWIAGLAGCAD